MTHRDSEKRRSAALATLAGTLEQVGFPHAMARIYAALTLAEGEGLSTGELVEQLGVSKASVSTSMHFLVGTELAERYRVPGSREAHYRILKGKWAAILAKKFTATTAVREAVEEAMNYTESERACERLREMREVYGFFEEEFADVMARWEARRKEER